MSEKRAAKARKRKRSLGLLHKKCNINSEMTEQVTTSTVAPRMSPTAEVARVSHVKQIHGHPLYCGLNELHSCLSSCLMSLLEIVERLRTPEFMVLFSLQKTLP